jgi:hypothetical protein
MTVAPVLFTMTLLFVATVQKDGWALHATIHVFTEYKLQWTVETVSVTVAGQEKDAIHSVWVMVYALTESVSVIL